LEHSKQQPDIYEGQLKDFKKNGHGKMTYSNGDIYVGTWLDDLPHGHGVKEFVNGDEYSGQWRNGKRHSDGVLKYADGSRYVGQWQNDLQHGNGVLYYPQTSSNPTSSSSSSSTHNSSSSSQADTPSTPSHTVHIAPLKNRKHSLPDRLDPSNDKQQNSNLSQSLPSPSSSSSSLSLAQQTEIKLSEAIETFEVSSDQDFFEGEWRDGKIVNQSDNLRLAALKRGAQQVQQLQQVLEDELKKGEAVDPETLCKICKLNKINTLFLECAHQVSCLECSKLTIKNCLVCGRRIVRVIQTFEI